MDPGFDSACELLDCRLISAVMRISSAWRAKLREIRLRRSKPLSVTVDDEELFVSADGLLLKEPKNAVTVTSESLLHSYRAALRNSVHAFEREISEGYVTVRNGVRVGFCGKAVYSDAGTPKITGLTDISSVNIRIAREIIGCSEEIYNRCFSGGLCYLLIAGPPSSGKTTILRDLSRLISQRYRVSLIDERNELAAVYEGIPANDIGSRTDVFTSYDKYSAIITAVRVMSPQVLICDEIGSSSEVEALRYAAFSGVHLIATCHASDMVDLMNKPAVSELMTIGAFDLAAFLGFGIKCGQITGIYETEKEICSDYRAVCL